jgi:NAD(P)-dependent dehydrogenase (short-subunit alcohol dehydrogenase family)
LTSLFILLGTSSRRCRTNTQQEVNVKGTLLMTQSFLKLVGDSKPATIINVASAGGISVIPHTSSYSLSKLVQIQMQRFVAVENPNITAISLHPGTVLTGITKPYFVKFSKDTFALAGGVAVWLATEQAKFMNGRYMGANWSVVELMNRKDEIVSKGLLMVELQGSFGKDQFED